MQQRCELANPFHEYILTAYKAKRARRQRPYAKSPKSASWRKAY
jgi:hypothetical protein